MQMTPSSFKKECKHDYDNPIRKGRAKYHCRKCDKDITIDIILLYDANNWNKDIKPLN